MLVVNALTWCQYHTEGSNRHKQPHCGSLIKCASAENWKPVRPLVSNETSPLFSALYDFKMHYFITLALYQQLFMSGYLTCLFLMLVFIVNVALHNSTNSSSTHFPGIPVLIRIWLSWVKPYICLVFVQYIPKHLSEVIEAATPKHFNF